MKIKLFVIQEEIGGIPEVPIIFTDEEQADAYYTQLVNENNNENCKTFKEASEYMEEYSGDNLSWFIRYWQLVI